MPTPTGSSAWSHRRTVAVAYTWRPCYYDMWGQPFESVDFVSRGMVLAVYNSVGDQPVESTALPHSPIAATTNVAGSDTHGR